MERDGILVEKRQGVLGLTLARPKVNAFDVPMAEALLAELEGVGMDGQVRCLLLTGQGRFFSAGQDVGTINQASPDVIEGELKRVYNRLILQLRRIPMPVVGAINGPAAGVGLGLALAADVRFAAQGARFVFGFSALGLTADSGVSLLLPVLVGLSRASAMGYLEEALTAEQALACGLVQQVLPDEALPETAWAAARRLAEGPTRAFALTKQAFNRTVLGGLEDCLELEAGLQSAAARTLDAREGVQAFLEKRPAHFEGV